jgi:cyclophilin family peptidyl-prolyl cis-trans isomerase
VADAWGKFKDESFALANDRGCLSMANAGPNGNGSQFFVCMRRTSAWDGKHVVFGRVVSGLRLFDRIGKDVNVDPTAFHKPLPGFAVVVEDCGAMPASYVPPPMAEPLRVGQTAPTTAAPRVAPAPVASAPAPAPAAPTGAVVSPGASAAMGGAAGASSASFAFLKFRVETPVGVAPIVDRVVVELLTTDAPAACAHFVQQCQVMGVHVCMCVVCVCVCVCVNVCALACTCACLPIKSLCSHVSMSSRSYLASRVRSCSHVHPCPLFSWRCAHSNVLPATRFAFCLHVCTGSASDLLMVTYTRVLGCRVALFVHIHRGPCSPSAPPLCSGDTA